MEKTISTTHLYFNIFNINIFWFFKKKSLIDERKNLQTIYFNVLSTHE